MENQHDSDNAHETSFFKLGSNESKSGKKTNQTGETINSLQIFTHLMMAHCLKDLFKKNREWLAQFPHFTTPLSSVKIYREVAFGQADPNVVRSPDLIYEIAAAFEKYFSLDLLFQTIDIVQIALQFYLIKVVWDKKRNITAAEVTGFVFLVVYSPLQLVGPAAQNLRGIADILVYVSAYFFLINQKGIYLLGEILVNSMLLHLDVTAWPFFLCLTLM
jgi:hypothetical protein